MFQRNWPVQRGGLSIFSPLFVLGLFTITMQPCGAQDTVIIDGGGLRNNNVGGVSVTAGGVVSQPILVDARRFQEQRQRALVPISDDLSKFTSQRRVSLRRLEEAISKHRVNQVTPLADEIRYLAGLQRIRYVLVYPDQRDIVLVGPAEGWKVDERGIVVGLTTERPVLQLDDLMVAIRTAGASNGAGISCSIDPTQEGLQRLRSTVSRMKTIGQPEATMRRIEEAMGPQVITVTGVPADSYFARVMVAADVRMKRLAMNFEESPIPGMPSFLELMKAGDTGMQNMLPRWWLAPDYDPLLTDADRLSWEIRGSGVQCMTETDFLTENGTPQRGVNRGSKAARRWAETMTAKYEELADRDSIFAQLRNIMDLAVVAALLEKEGLLQRARLELPHMISDEATEIFNAPRQVASQVSFIKRGRNWLISASGGVQIFPWEVADRSETSETLAPIRAKALVLAENWWAN